MSRTTVNLSTVSQALLGSESSASAEVESVAVFLEGLIGADTASMLMLCARLGAMDTENQVRVREEISSRQDVADMLGTVEKMVTGKVFLGGAEPNGDDARLAAALYNLFALLYKPEDREKYPAVLGWFERCTERLGAILGGPHMLGKPRAGGQIDCFADSVYVRGNADFTNELNANVKKKKTQRQLEKELKAQTKTTVPESASSFQFEESVSADAPNEEKIQFVSKAFAKVGANTDFETIYHTAAHTMADMPKDLAAKGGFVCKNLFLKAKKPRKGVENDSCLWLISVPQEAEVNLKTLSKELGYKDELRQTKPELLLETLGVKPGCVTPLGLLNDSQVRVNVILDEEMMSQEANILWLHPLTNEATIGVSAGDLLKVISATARKPLLVHFDRAGAQAVAQVASPAATEATAEPLGISHEEARERLWARLKEAGVVPEKEVNPDLTAKRPVGHSTHNLFVKDKKTKKLFMIAMAQSKDVNLKDVAKKVGAKELRMSSDAPAAFCLEKGCMTLLSLYNNVQGTVTPVVDSDLFKQDTLCICAGCNDALDHSQHNVVNVKPELVKALLAESNTPATIEIDME